MPWNSVVLKPGVDVERTPTFNQAGYSESQLIRFKDGLAQKVGGWQAYYPFAVGGIPRALHAWQDVNENQHLAIGATSSLSVLSSGALLDLSPQVLTTDGVPDLVTASGSANVTVNDANVTAITDYSAVEFRTPVSIGGLILSGLYPVDAFLGTGQFRIVAASNAATTKSNTDITGATQANPCVITVASHTFSDGDLVYIDNITGMTELNNRLFTVANSTATTFELSGENSSGYTAYSSGGVASPAHVPFYTTTSGEQQVSVTLADHGLAVGGTFVAPVSTTLGGVVISGAYTVVSVTSTDIFKIAVDALASSTATAPMNGGDVELKYYISLGPAASGGAYGTSTYSSGGYSTGTAVSAQTGSALTTTDWTHDNWGSTLISVPTGGGVYAWTPDTGFQNAKLIATAPPFNAGAFVTAPAQILIAWGSTEYHEIGVDQDPLTYRWSDQLDYEFWTAGVNNPATGTLSQAGSSRIPTGSRIVAGMQSSQQALLWTDLDLWAINYLGQPNVGLIFGQTPVGRNCGAIGKHAVGQLGNTVVWMGQSNFYAYSGGGVRPLPCSVWDAVFQDIDRTNAWKVRAAPNTPFNEMWWFYPSASGGTGENDKYVKVNITDGSWDRGDLPRSAWIDESVLGNPIGADPTGVIYQHETGYDNNGQALEWSFRTGYWSINEGEDVAFVDMLIPDFRYGTFGGATDARINVTLYSVMHPNDTELVYGPYEMTSSTGFVTTRLRGRQMAIKVSGSDLGTFARIGRLRYRWAPAGRM